MYRFISRVACAAALLATPGLAHAGTSTATGSASMNVLNQCSVTGANVNLGTFTTNNTWADVAAQLGSMQNGNYNAGSQGLEYANFGSVTCDVGTPYTVFIRGSSSEDSGNDIIDGLKFTLNGKKVNAWIYIKKIGGVTVADSGFFRGAGARAFDWGATATGTGSPQTIMGSAPFDFFLGTSTAALTDKLATAGTYSDTLTYTLNF